MKLLSNFQWVTQKVNILALTATVSKSKIRLLLSPSLVKMLIFVLPTKSAKEFHFGHFFKYFGNHNELEKAENTTKLLLMQEYLSKVIVDSPLFCFKVILLIAN